MKKYSSYSLATLSLVALAPLVRADNEVTLRRLDVDAPHHVTVHREKTVMETERTTFLGVETAPVGRALSTQLSLIRGTGLIVTHVVEKSPAADVLKEDDILTKLDDQLLVNMAQLGVLIRGHKEGDSIKLTLVRAGKELTVAAKLAMHDAPKLAEAFHLGGWPGDLEQGDMIISDAPGLARLRELPGMGRDDARDVLRMIQRERGNSLTGPGIHVLARGGHGSTIVDLPKSNISYSDDDGSIEIKVDEGKRNLTVKNAKGEIAFTGPINTDDERKKLPPDVSQRLQKLENDTLSVDVDDDFQPEVMPLPSEPKKTKISFSPAAGKMDRQERSRPAF